jgi:hypothetical protein
VTLPNRADTTSSLQHLTASEQRTSEFLILRFM